MNRLPLILLLLPLLALSTSAFADHPLLDADFSPGHLPPNWTDNHSPNTSATYTPTTADQTPLTRVTPTKGQPQLSIPLPPSAGDTDAYYRLTLTARSVTHSPLQLSLRPAAGPSRKPIWSATRELLEIPSDTTISFHLPKQPSPLLLTLTLPAAGTVDLGHLTLTQMSRDELVAQMKKDFPKGGTPHQNLLRVSRFPTGVQAGGSISRDISDEQYTVDGDPSVVGPSGAPALKLHCDQPLRFFLPPAVIPWTFTKHTATVYVRGHGTGSLHVLGDGADLAAQPFSVNSDAWQRVTLTFDPAFLAREHQLALDITGTVYADAFQLEPGTRPTPYVKRPEVALSLPDTDASVVRIQFDDDPAVVNFTVTTAGDSNLNARVYNIYGENKQLPDVALVPAAEETTGPTPTPAAADLARGSLGYEVFAGHSFGAFRIEAWVEDQNGKRISPYAETVVLRVPRPRAWDEDAPDSPFGVHLGPVHRQMVLAKAVGINWARLHDAGADATAWSFVEPEKGQWHWSDENVKRYRDHHLSLLGTLQQSPGFASGLGHPATDYWDRYLEPTDLKAWSNYVHETTAHYKDSIQAWDIWNEPWLKFWSKWDPAKKESFRSPTAAKDYAALETAAFTAAKSVLPTATLLGLNTTGGSHGRSWSKAVADAGGLPPCTAYSYHSYTNETAGFPNDVCSHHFHDAFDPILAKLHPTTAPTTSPSSPPSSFILHPSSLLDKPVWMTEGSGTNLSITRGFYHYSAPGEDPEDATDVADKLARYETSTLAQGVSKLFLYHINVGGEFHPGPGAFQSLVTDDGFPEPSACAQAVLAWHLEGRHFVKRIELAPGVYASCFTGDNHSVAVLTSAPSHDRYTLPSDIIALDLRDLFGNDLPGGSDFTGRTTYADLQGTPAELEKVLHHGGTHRPSPSTHPTR